MIINKEILNSPTYEDIQMIREFLSKIEYTYWIQDSLFSWQWWFLLVATVIPWLIWWKLVDKKRFLDILTFGFWWMIIAVILDDIGVALYIWDYPKQLTHLMPPLVPADLTVIPVAFMFIYQYFNRWKTFLFGSIFVAFIFSFIIEPFFQRNDMLDFPKRNIEWSHLTSFILFIILSLSLRLFHLYVLKKVKVEANKNL